MKSLIIGKGNEYVKPEISQEEKAMQFWRDFHNSSENERSVLVETASREARTLASSSCNCFSDYTLGREERNYSIN